MHSPRRVEGLLPDIIQVTVVKVCKDDVGRVGKETTNQTPANKNKKHLEKKNSGAVMLSAAERDKELTIAFFCPLPACSVAQHWQQSRTCSALK